MEGKVLNCEKHGKQSFKLSNVQKESFKLSKAWNEKF